MGGVTHEHAAAIVHTLHDAARPRLASVTPRCVAQRPSKVTPRCMAQYTTFSWGVRMHATTSFGMRAHSNSNCTICPCTVVLAERVPLPAAHNFRVENGR